MTEVEWESCREPRRMLDSLPQSDYHEGKYDRKLRLFACACARSVWYQYTDPRLRKAVEVAELYADGLITWQEKYKTYDAASNAASGLGAYWDNVWLPAFAVSESVDILHWWTRADSISPDILRHIFGNTFKRPFFSQPCLSCVEDRNRAEDSEKRGYREHASLLREGASLCSDCSGKGWFPISAPDWPNDVLALATVCYETATFEECDCLNAVNPHVAGGWDCNKCSRRGFLVSDQPTFALRDALLEMGLPELADHFSYDDFHLDKPAAGHWGPQFHPKGCWVLDLILGKE